MAENTILGRRTKENSRFFLNTIEIPGVQNVGGSYNVNSEHLNYLGLSTCRNAPRGAYNGSFNVNALLISDDQFIHFTGNSGFNGYIVGNNNVFHDNFSFTSGYLSSYICKGEINQIPTLDIGINVLGNIGALQRKEQTSLQTENDFNIISDIKSSLLLKIADASSINIDLDEFSNNRVLSYNLSINIKRLPVYPLGFTLPSIVEIIYPIEVNCSFSLDQNDYLASTIRDFPKFKRVKNFTISMNDLENGQPFISYNFGEMTFMGESYSATTNGNVGINLNYKTYLPRPN